ncbi:hypothetical protein [Streptomyces afghaniensis]|uniref:hypothetical protein n=1 Tax=Streptomyces afghaniensis TaxID=66865 RepID=UPI00278B3DBD|nr:hypothetical protein [Streptomyces afghaniensis]MDQ1021610.1 hypothetical protein [Streptomyces afghaniensis]
MRSARMLLATATATAALAIAAPAAYAEAMGDWDHDTTSYSKEHHKDGKHHAPHGGMHTGGGALSAVTADDAGDDQDHRKDSEHGKDSEQGKDSEHGKHEGPGKDSGHGEKHHKPHGGMDTGSGALAAVNSDDWEEDTRKDGEGGDDSWGDKQEEDSWGGKQEEHGKHDKGSWHGEKDHKPHGGMHTGGGALAAGPGVTAGGLAVLAVAGTGLYALRRQKASRGVA